MKDMRARQLAHLLTVLNLVAADDTVAGQLTQV
jgi:hypothetical protein